MVKDVEVGFNYNLIRFEILKYQLIGPLNMFKREKGKIVRIGTQACRWNSGWA